MGGAFTISRTARPFLAFLPSGLAIADELLAPLSVNAPIGAFSGRINITADFGLLNNPCNSSIDLGFTLLEGSINTGDLIDPKPVGSTDVFKPLAVDGNGNGIPDGAERYPSFLNTLFANAQPVRRLFGTAHVQGSWMTWNIVYFAPGSHIFVGNDKMTFDESVGVPAILIFNDPTAPPLLGAVTDMCAPLLIDMITLGRTIDNPCTPVSVAGANCPISSAGGSQIDNRGYPFFPCETGNSADEDGDGAINDGCPQTGPISEAAIPGACDNNISDDTEDSDMNDGCPVVGGQSEGDRMPGTCSGSDEGGCVALVNPEAGTYSFTTYVSSQRDADGDGIENSLDVCFADPNPDWNPRVYDQATDTDGDGLPNACDPGGIEPREVAARERQERGGGRSRRLAQGHGARDDDDLCAVRLGLGDACDVNPQAPDGTSASYCLGAPLAIGSGPATVVPATRSGEPNCAFAEIPIVVPPPGFLPPATSNLLAYAPTPTATAPPPRAAGIVAAGGVGGGGADGRGPQPAALPRTGGGSTGGGSLAGLVLLGGALVVGGAALSARRGGRRHRRP